MDDDSRRIPLGRWTADRGQDKENRESVRHAVSPPTATANYLTVVTDSTLTVSVVCTVKVVCTCTVVKCRIKPIEPGFSGRITPVRSSCIPSIPLVLFVSHLCLWRKVRTPNQASKSPQQSYRIEQSPFFLGLEASWFFCAARICRTKSKKQISFWIFCFADAS